MVGYGLGPESQHRHSKKRTLARRSARLRGSIPRLAFPRMTGTF
nr:MAG TPA: hypothetical protein [Caudoviricetes sp.]